MSDANSSSLPAESPNTGINRNSTGMPTAAGGHAGMPGVAGTSTGTSSGGSSYLEQSSSESVPVTQPHRYTNQQQQQQQHRYQQISAVSSTTANSISSNGGAGMIRRRSLVGFHPSSTGGDLQTYTVTNNNPQQQSYFTGTPQQQQFTGIRTSTGPPSGGDTGESQLKMDSTGGVRAQRELEAVRRLLAKHGLNDTGSAMDTEMKSKQFRADDVISDDTVRQRLDLQLSGMENPVPDYDTYRWIYFSFSAWTHNALSEHRRELFEVLFVVFVEMWLRLFKEVPTKAALFLNEFASDHQNTKRLDVCAMKAVLHPYQLKDCSVPQSFISGPVVLIKMRVFAYKLLMTHIVAVKSSVLLDIIISRISFRIVPLGNPSEAEVDIIGASCPASLHFDSYMINSEPILWGLAEEAFTADELVEAGTDHFEKPAKVDCGQFPSRYDGEPTVPIDPAKLAPTVPEPQSWTASFWHGRSLKHYMNREVVSETRLPSVLAFDWDSQLDITAVTVSRTSVASSACALGDCSIRLCNVPASEEARANRYTAKRRADTPVRTATHAIDIDSEYDPQPEDAVTPRPDDNTDGLALPEPPPESILLGHEGNIYALEFSANDRILLSGGVDDSIRLWSVNEASCLATYSAHRAVTWDIAFAPYDHYFASGGADATARLWALDRSYPLRVFADYLSCVNVVKFHPNGSYLATGSADGRVGLVDIRAARTCRLFFGTSSSVLGLAVSHNGRLIASGNADGSIILWDIAAGKQVDVIREHKGAVRSLAFSHGSRLLASAATDMTVKLWDIANAACTMPSGAQSVKGAGDIISPPGGPPQGHSMEGNGMRSQMGAGGGMGAVPGAFGEDHSLDRRLQTSYNSPVFGSDRLCCSLPLRDRTVASLTFTPRNLLVVCGVGRN